MRTRITLFLLSTIVVFGCVQQAEQSQQPMNQGKQEVCTAENPCVTVHPVILDGTCPDTLRLGSQDVVKFINRSGGGVNIRNLNVVGKLTSDPFAKNPRGVRLSGKKLIRLTADDTLGYLQVNKNPYPKESADSLIFDYVVKYPGPDSCKAPPDSVLKRMANPPDPPTMIVGPDTL